MSAVQQGEFAQGPSASYRIGALLYFCDAAGRVLLMRRRKKPNLGLWCAVGGKLEMASGESPYECACREAAEEVGVSLQANELALRCILAERDYQGTGHWLMFVFTVTPPLAKLPPAHVEGEFAFFDRSELSSVEMPELDRDVLSKRIQEDPRSLHVMRYCGTEDVLVEEERLDVSR